MISILRPATDAVALLDRQLGAAHAVRAAGRERPFERGQQADLHRRPAASMRCPRTRLPWPRRAACDHSPFVHSHGCLLRFDRDAAIASLMKWTAGAWARLQARLEATPQAEQSVGENSTMARNTPPMTRLKRSRSIRSIAKFCSSTNTIAPMNGADRMPHAAEHGDDEDVDEPRRADRAGRDEPVVPDEQHAADRRDDARHRVRRDAVRDDVDSRARSCAAGCRGCLAARCRTARGPGT